LRFGAHLALVAAEWMRRKAARQNGARTFVMTDQPWQDGYWESADGLKLHYRDWPGRADRPALLCIPGLTRNARDFEPLVAQLAGAWRVLAVDLRGRGDSDYARDTSTYVPATYVADMIAFVQQVAPGQVVTVGTSLGGIVSVLLANFMPQIFAGMVINDIGPVIEPVGLERIREHVGQGRSYPTWMHAARALKEMNSKIYPDYQVADWLRMAKQLMVITNGGRVGLDYDMRIAEPLEAAGDEPVGDLWPAFRNLPSVPKLVLRGGLSDLLSAATLKAMKKDMGDTQVVTVKRVGHVPTMVESEARTAIAALLAKVAGGAA
jgi:pimeloyl-ACP methyl ester carboxylesterase